MFHYSCLIVWSCVLAFLHCESFVAPSWLKMSSFLSEPHPKHLRYLRSTITNIPQPFPSLVGIIGGINRQGFAHASVHQMLEASPRHIDLTVKQAANRHAMESSTVGYAEVALELTFPYDWWTVGEKWWQAKITHNYAVRTSSEPQCESKFCRSSQGLGVSNPHGHCLECMAPKTLVKTLRESL